MSWSIRDAATKVKSRLEYRSRRPWPCRGAHHGGGQGAVVVDADVQRLHQSEEGLITE
jgi:hypothetical protein